MPSVRRHRSPLLLALVVLLIAAATTAAGLLMVRAASKADEYTAPVGPDRASTLRAGDLNVTVPSGASSRDRTLRVRAVEDDDAPDLVEMHGPRYEIRLEGRLSKRAKLSFALPSDAIREQHFFALRRVEGSDRWRPVRGRVREGRLIVRTRGFSDWRIGSWSVPNLAEKAGNLYRSVVDTRIDPPECPTLPEEAALTVEPTDDQAVFACLISSGVEYELTLFSNRAVGLSVPVPVGWQIESVYGASLGDAVSTVLTDAARSLTDRRGDSTPIVLLPSAGKLVLRARERTNATFKILADNSGATFDAVLNLLAVSQVGKLTKDERTRKRLLEATECLLGTINNARDLNRVDTAATAVRCVAAAGWELPKAAVAVLVRDLAKNASAQVEAFKNVFDGSSSPTVTVRFQGAKETEAEPRPKPPVRRPRPPRPDPRRAQHPTCAEYKQLSGPDADAALRALVTDYEGQSSSLSLARLSLAAFCRLNPGRSIAGIYGGGSEGTQPATTVPTCEEFLQMSDAQADAVLDLIATQHNDDSGISTRRLSASAFCQLNPSRKVDGIYGGP